jgi:hypothetical protein
VQFQRNFSPRKVSPPQLKNTTRGQTTTYVYGTPNAHPQRTVTEPLSAPTREYQYLEGNHMVDSEIIKPKFNPNENTPNRDGLSPGDGMLDGESVVNTAVLTVGDTNLTGWNFMDENLNNFDHEIHYLPEDLTKTNLEAKRQPNGVNRGWTVVEDDSPPGPWPQEATRDSVKIPDTFVSINNNEPLGLYNYNNYTTASYNYRETGPTQGGYTNARQRSESPNPLDSKCFYSEKSRARQGQASLATGAP